MNLVEQLRRLLYSSPLHQRIQSKHHQVRFHKLLIGYKAWWNYPKLNPVGALGKRIQR